MSKDSDKWNQRYLQSIDVESQPAFILKQYDYLLPSQGIALDLACGQGGNAIYLAEKGIDVQAWDFSSIAIASLNQWSKSRDLQIHTQVRNVAEQPPHANQFDVIVVSYFLDRTITRSIANALKPDGLLFYQTFTQKKDSDTGPSNPDYLLKDNELLHLFDDLQVRVYREETDCGDKKKGLRNEALFIGQKTG